MDDVTLRRRILSWYRKHKRDCPGGGREIRIGFGFPKSCCSRRGLRAVIPYYERFLVAISRCVGAGDRFGAGVVVPSGLDSAITRAPPKSSEGR